MDGRGSTVDLQPWRAEHVAQGAKASAMAASGREQKEKNGAGRGAAWGSAGGFSGRPGWEQGGARRRLEMGDWWPALEEADGAGEDEPPEQTGMSRHGGKRPCALLHGMGSVGRGGQLEHREFGLHGCWPSSQQWGPGRRARAPWGLATERRAKGARAPTRNLQGKDATREAAMRGPCFVGKELTPWCSTV
jgi:hypothetical protein